MGRGRKGTKDVEARCERKGRDREGKRKGIEDGRDIPPQPLQIAVGGEGGGGENSLPFFPPYSSSSISDSWVHLLFLSSTFSG